MYIENVEKIFGTIEENFIEIQFFRMKISHLYSRCWKQICESCRATRTRFRPFLVILISSTAVKVALNNRRRDRGDSFYGKTSLCVFAMEMREKTENANIAYKHVVRVPSRIGLDVIGLSTRRAVKQ